MNLDNSTDIIANRIHLIKGSALTNLVDLFLTKDEAQYTVSIAPDTLDTLAEMANAIGNGANFLATVNNQLAFQANIADVDNNIYT